MGPSWCLIWFQTTHPTPFTLPKTLFVDILDLDVRINPNPFLNERYGYEHHIWISWSHLEFLIFTSSVRSVLQSHEGFLLDDLINLRIFLDIEACCMLNCMYFVKQIHWCTQNNLWMSSTESEISSMHLKGSIRNISGPLLVWDI